MRIISTLLLGLSFGILAACAPKAEPENSGPWSLVSSQSNISYVTIKNGTLGEVNTFGEISGSVSEGGQAVFTVNLGSVDTSNEIRDPRMKEFLFETAKYPTARASANLNMAQFNSFAIGGSKYLTLGMTLDLHGVAEQFDVDVTVTRIGANKVRVDTKGPLLIDAEDFGFETGLAKLQELAGLESITPVVSATVGLTFER